MMRTFTEMLLLMCTVPYQMNQSKKRKTNILTGKWEGKNE